MICAATATAILGYTYIKKTIYLPFFKSTSNTWQTENAENLFV